MSLDYPVDVSLAGPSAFTPGGFVTIQPSLYDVGQVDLTTQSPFLTASLDFNLAVNATGTVNVAGSHPFNYDPTLTENLAKLSSGTTLASGDFDGLGFELSIPDSFTSAGTTTAPGSGGLESAQATGSAPFLKADADLVKLAEFLGAPTDLLSGSIGPANYDLFSATLNGTLSLVLQSFFTPTAIDVTVTPNFGAPAQTHALGQPFTFQVPDTWKQSVSFSESYSLVGTLTDVLGIQESADLDVTIGKFKAPLFDPAALYTHDFSLGTSSILPIYTTQIPESLSVDGGGSLTLPESLAPSPTGTGGGTGGGTVPTPIVNAVASRTVAEGSTIMLASLFSAVEQPNGSGVAPQYYRFTLDPGLSGQFVIGGLTLGSGAQATNADLAAAYFLAGSTTGTGNIGIVAYDTQGTPSTEADVSVTVIAPTPPPVQPGTSGPTIVFTGNGPILQVGATLQFSIALLDAMETGVDPSQLRYTLDSPPSFGVIQKSGVSISSFTQADINNGVISYIENGTAASGDSFSYHVMDASGRQTPISTFSLGIIAKPVAPTPTNPTIVTNSTLTVGLGGAGFLTDANLEVSDSEVSSWQVLYHVTTAPQHGTLTFGEGGDVMHEFTQQELDIGAVWYNSDGSASGSDSFAFTVSDVDGGAISANVFDINTIPLNNLQVSAQGTAYLDPALDQVRPGATFPSVAAQITPEMLSATDPGIADSDITYTVTDMPNPTDAQMWFFIGQWNGTDFSGQSFNEFNVQHPVFLHSFTQQEVDDGQVFYVQRGQSTQFPYGTLESVTLDASDSVGNSVTGIVLPIIPEPPGLLSNGVFYPNTDPKNATVNLSFGVPIGGSVTINSSMLTQLEEPFTDDQLVYICDISGLLHGKLELDGAPLAENTHITQADIDEGRVAYVEDGSAAASDTFSLFPLGGGDALGESALITMLMAGTNGGRVFSDHGTAVTFFVGPGNNWILGAHGDTLSYANAPAGVSINLATGKAQNGFGGTDTIRHINSVLGSSHDDTLIGNAANNVLNGGQGADTMRGGAGNDTYYVDNPGDVVKESTNAGTDTVYASVNYVLPAGSSIEFLRANAGATGLTLSGNPLDNTIIGGDGNDTLKGGAGDDTLRGNAGNDVLNGGPGADTMFGGTGDDTYYVDNAGDVVKENAGEGTDTVYASVSYALLAGSSIEFLRANAGATGLSLAGNAFANTIIGGVGNDTLRGGGGNDTLNGGAGNDTLWGGAGADILTGGAGADVFVFAGLSDSTVASAGRDTITDFSSVEGDKIDLHFIDAKVSLPGNNAFTFIGTSAFSGAAGELRYAPAGGNTLIFGDVNGDGVADFSILVKGAHAFGASDFVL